MNNCGQAKVTLPVWHSEKDAQWLTEQLLKLHPSNRITACTGYSNAYREALNAQEVEYKKENSARKAANARMRSFIAKCLDSYAEQVINPAISAYNQNEYKQQENSSNFSIDSL